jgi:hypothetical protein
MRVCALHAVRKILQLAGLHAVSSTGAVAKASSACVQVSDSGQFVASRVTRSPACTWHVCDVQCDGLYLQRKPGGEVNQHPQVVGLSGCPEQGGATLLGVCSAQGDPLAATNVLMRVLLCRPLVAWLYPHNIMRL